MSILRNLLRGLLDGGKASSRDDLDSGEFVSMRFVRKPDVPSILVATHSYAGNGAAEMLTFLLAKFISNFGWQVHALDDGISNRDKKILADIGVGLVDFVDPAQYDLAIMNTVVSGLEYLSKFSGILPCILWVHEGEFVLFNSSLPISFWKRSFVSARHIVFQSKWQAERIFGSFTSTLPADGYYSVIPNCLPSLPVFNKERSKKTGVKRIVFVGGVYERKRPGDLVHAVLMLQRKDVECMLIGTDAHVSTLSDEVRQVLRNDRRFVVTGELPRNEVAACIASADVVVLPSMDESQPLILMEAAHFGKPLIISDLAVYKETWHSGINCLMHPVGDVQVLARHLSTALDGNAPIVERVSDVDCGEAVFIKSFKAVFDKIWKSDKLDSKYQVQIGEQRA